MMNLLRVLLGGRDTWPHELTDEQRNMLIRQEMQRARLEDIEREASIIMRQPNPRPPQ
jgi:hypothetical protein